MGQPERIREPILRRIRNAFMEAILQLRTAREPYPGVMHLSIFWGMLALGAGTVLATWNGGQLTLPEVARWIDLLPPRGYLDLRGASDLALEAFLKELGQQSLMLEQARAAGIVVTPTQRAILDSAYRRNLAAAAALLGITAGSALPQGTGAERVAALIEGLTTDREQWRPLPGAKKGSNATVLPKMSGWAETEACNVASICGSCGAACSMTTAISRGTRSIGRSTFSIRWAVAWTRRRADSSISPMIMRRETR